jgi:hypothetical protein
LRIEVLQPETKSEDIGGLAKRGQGVTRGGDKQMRFCPGEKKVSAKKEVMPISQHD